jgi:hypothetical protein
MEKTNILYIGRHPEIMETVVRLINKNETWNGLGTADDDMAMALFTNMDFQLVLLGCGINEEDELKLRNFFSAVNPNTKIVQHYGGGSGLLYNEITAALYDGIQTANFLS